MAEKKEKISTATVIRSRDFEKLSNTKLIFKENIQRIEPLAFYQSKNLDIIFEKDVNNSQDGAFAFCSDITVSTSSTSLIEELMGVIGVELIIAAESEFVKSQRHLAAMPEKAKEIILKSTMPETDHVARVAARRKEILEKFPWADFITPNHIDLQQAKKFLDEQLFGLELAKTEVLRRFAMSNHNPDAPISPLLMIGPPGVGKTVFARSIAAAANKPLGFISLPSLSVGWELVGANMGWTGAEPGRIVLKIAECKALPVFCLDELDKCSTQNERYPSVANVLLNMLDGSSVDFFDDFMEMEFDLSRAIIILTANERDAINPFLLDRCEVIQLSGYHKYEERLTILKDFVIPKFRKEMKITEEEFEFTDEICKVIIENSKDAQGGVRVIERNCKKLFGEICYQLEMESKPSVKLNLKKIESVLNENPNVIKKIGFS